jgi:hypothetical protein
MTLDRCEGEGQIISDPYLLLPKLYPGEMRNVCDTHAPSGHPWAWALGSPLTRVHVTVAEAEPALLLAEEEEEAEVTEADVEEEEDDASCAKTAPTEARRRMEPKVNFIVGRLVDWGRKG